MRRHYETEQDRSREHNAITHVGRLWNCKGFKLPDRYWIDYALTRNGRVCAWAEVKCRTMKYPTIILSMQKVMFGRLLAKETGLPFFLIVMYENGDWFYLDITAAPFTLGWGGVGNMRDSQDREPLCHFAIPKTLQHFDGGNYVENYIERQR